MSHTNKTTHYNLPQFIGSDKASWLGDLNPAFDTIDGELYAINTTATDADSKADSAQASADNAIALSNSNINSINEIKKMFSSVQKTIPFTSAIKGGTLTCNCRYIKSLGIVSVWGNFTNTNASISGGSVIGSLNGVLDSSYSGEFYGKLIYVHTDSSFSTRTIRINNSLLTAAEGESTVSIIAYSFVFLVDPEYIL